MKFATRYAAAACCLLFGACSGSSGQYAVPYAAGIPQGSQGGSRPTSAQYSITYLPVDSGCTVSEPPVLAQNGIVGVNEICGSSGHLVDYVYNHGVITHLDAQYEYVDGINSSDHALVQGLHSNFLILDVRANVAVPLQGTMSVGSAINDAEYVAGTVQLCANPNPLNYLQCPQAARFSPDGSYQVLSPESHTLGAYINASGAVLGWSSAPTLDALIFEKNGTVDINNTIHASPSQPYGLNDEGHAIITVGPPYYLQLKTYVFTGSSTPVLIPPLYPNQQNYVAGINDQDDVVGSTCKINDQAPCVGFLYKMGANGQSSSEVALTTVAPGYVDGAPVAINNIGEILVETQHAGQTVPALLIPFGCDP